MGITTDQEIISLIGTDEETRVKYMPTMEHCLDLNIFTQNQALSYLGTKLVPKRYFTTQSKTKTPLDDARDVINQTILSHIPVENFNYRLKAIYLALMVRLTFDL